MYPRSLVAEMCSRADLLTISISKNPSARCLCCTLLLLPSAAPRISAVRRWATQHGITCMCSYMQCTREQLPSQSLSVGSVYVQYVPQHSIVWVSCREGDVRIYFVRGCQSSLMSGLHSEVTNRAANFLSSSAPLTSSVNNGIAVRWKSSSYKSYICSKYLACI